MSTTRKHQSWPLNCYKSCGFKVWIIYLQKGWGAEPKYNSPGRWKMKFLFSLMVCKQPRFQKRVFVQKCHLDSGSQNQQTKEYLANHKICIGAARSLQTVSSLLSAACLSLLQRDCLERKGLSLALGLPSLTLACFSYSGRDLCSTLSLQTGRSAHIHTLPLEG